MEVEVEVEDEEEGRCLRSRPAFLYVAATNLLQKSASRSVCSSPLLKRAISACARACSEIIARRF